MNKLEIIEYLKTNNKSGSKSRIGHIKNKFPDCYNEIIKINFTDNWYEKLFSYLNNITKKPKCKNILCKNDVNFGGYSKGYYGYCSTECKNRDTNFINGVKKSLTIKYGVDNPMKLNSVVNKMKTTKKNRYGDENYCNNIKMKITKKNRYGDENYNNREGAQETSLRKYNKINYTNRKKAEETSLKKYGDEHYNNREKQFKTNLDKYGVKIFNNSEKAKQTSLEKYGETSYLKTNEYKNKMYLKSIEKCANKLNLKLNSIKFNGINYVINNYCDVHSFFEINKYVLKNRILYGIENLCTICNPISEQSSIKEKEISEFIKTLNINQINNERSILNGKEIDIYLPDHKLGIEFNGLYWHSNIKIMFNYHLIKTEECEKQGIQLLHVFEDEWIMKKDIVKSIIKSKLGIIENKYLQEKLKLKKLVIINWLEIFLKQIIFKGLLEVK
jgi:hypothetical protein